MPKLNRTNPPKPRRASTSQSLDAKTDLILGHDKSGNPQLRTVRKDSWTANMRAIFLDHLAATCNVTLSAEAASKKAHQAYSLRRSDTGFADLWDKALETGYAAIETMLLERAKADIEMPSGDGPHPPDPKNMSTDLALKLLGEYRKMIAGAKRGNAGPDKSATEDETNAIIIKRLRALYIRMQKERANDDGSGMGLEKNQK